MSFVDRCIRIKYLDGEEVRVTSTNYTKQGNKFHIILLFLATLEGEASSYPLPIWALCSMYKYNMMLEENWLWGMVNNPETKGFLDL